MQNEDKWYKIKSADEKALKEYAKGVDFLKENVFGDSEENLCKDAEITSHVNSPKHYNKGKIEVIEYIEDQDLGFCLGNAIKYISRAGSKQDFEGQDQITKTVEDLRKAIWYIERRIIEIEKDLCS